MGWHRCSLGRPAVYLWSGWRTAGERIRQLMQRANGTRRVEARPRRWTVRRTPGRRLMQRAPGRPIRDRPIDRPGYGWSRHPPDRPLVHNDDPVPTRDCAMADGCSGMYDGPSSPSPWRHLGRSSPPPLYVPGPNIAAAAAAAFGAAVDDMHRLRARPRARPLQPMDAIHPKILPQRRSSGFRVTVRTL